MKASLASFLGMTVALAPATTAGAAPLETAAGRGCRRASRSRTCAVATPRADSEELVALLELAAPKLGPSKPTLEEGAR